MPSIEREEKRSWALRADDRHNGNIAAVDHSAIRRQRLITTRSELDADSVLIISARNESLQPLNRSPRYS